MAYREDHPFVDAMIKKGHIPKREADGDIDIFVTDYENHNGPGCIVCEETWCWHCTRSEDIKPCIGAEETARLKAKRRREYEDEILAKAEEIKARRAAEQKQPLPILRFWLVCPEKRTAKELTNPPERQITQWVADQICLDFCHLMVQPIIPDIFVYHGPEPRSPASFVVGKHEFTGLSVVAAFELPEIEWRDD